LFRSLVRRSASNSHGSDITQGERVTDLLRWGSAMFPEHRSFGALAKGGIDFVLVRRRLAASSAAAVIGIASLSYYAVGYVHFKRLAIAERTTAEGTERANAELQGALAGLRDELATAQARIDTLSEEAKRQLAVSETAKADRIAQLTRALDQAQRDLHLGEAQRATLAARLSKDATDLADGQQKQSQAQSSLDQTQKKLQQLTTERDKAAAERDHLRTRVGELEQKLSAVQTRQAPRPVAEARPEPAAPAAAPAPAVAAAAPIAPRVAVAVMPAPVVAAAPAVAAAPPPAAAPAVAAPEQPRQVAVVIPSAPTAEPARIEAPRSAASVPAAAVNHGGLSQVERVLASTGVDVRHLFAQFGVTSGEGGPFIPASQAPQSAGNASPEKLAALVKTLPVSAPLESYQVGSPFGVRGDPINGHSSYHTGLDLQAPYMSPVYATAAGTVTYSGYRDDYGKVVEIDHGNGIATRYAHLHRQTVSVGQRVVAHTQIGFLGSTGRATGPHVHYEVLVNGEPQDPAKFLGLARLVAAAQRS
jgi:murein DD-endopeptidase MepM/ murein hydrolase activator NlpD